MDRRNIEIVRRILGRNIRRLRLARGMSQEELGAESSLRQAQISEMESGRRNATIDNVIRIAMALGTRVGDLFEDGKHG